MIAALLATCTSIYGESLWHRVDDRLDITGTKTYGLQVLSVDGSRDMFFDDNYGFSPQYRNETNLTVTGRLLPGLSVTATLSNNRWNPNERTMVFNYERKSTRAAYGDITASLTGNELIPFVKRIHGATIAHDFGFAKVTAIASKIKAAARTVTLTGNNTPGPYYLGASQIIDGSERVKVDETEIPRSDATGMPNYTFDAFAGILIFRDGFIVPSTSQITVSFETQGYNSVAGSIYGLRSDIPVGKGGNVGFTYLTQASDKSSGLGREITEPFHGNNSLSLPYELLYIPVEGSVTVKVDGILQSPIVDYTINYSLHYILFNRPIPSSSTILVSYIPRGENAVSSDRSVMGLDASYRLSDNLTVSGQFAKSNKDYTGSKNGGTATSLRAVGNYGKLNLTAVFKNIGENYASVESAGFFRNERGGGIDMRYAFNEQLSWFSRFDRYKRPPFTFGITSPDTDIVYTTTQSVNGFEWKPDKNLPQLRLTSTRMNSSGGTDSDSMSTDALTMNWSRNKLGISGEISRSSRDEVQLSPYDGTLVKSSNSVDTSRLSLRYLPGHRFSLISDISYSNVNNSNGAKTNARNYQFTANYTPIDSVNVAAIYRISDSGGHYDTPYTGVGSNYGGYPVTGSSGWGYPAGGYLPSFGLKSTMRMINIGWAPSKKFSFDSSFNYNYSEGENNTNTTVTGTDLGFSYTPVEKLTLRAHSSRQNGSFIGSSGDMSSRIGFLTLS
ncbi:MAG TPA: hypothetical protein PLZ21_04370, partial [Armatimonadota bacterium]|nr:hypothetical protein [Armatimonadota bacterium]